MLLRGGFVKGRLNQLFQSEKKMQLIDRVVLNGVGEVPEDHSPIPRTYLEIEEDHEEARTRAQASSWYAAWSKDPLNLPHFVSERALYRCMPWNHGRSSSSRSAPRARDERLCHDNGEECHCRRPHGIEHTNIVLVNMPGSSRPLLNLGPRATPLGR